MQIDTSHVTTVTCGEPTPREKKSAIASHRRFKGASWAPRSFERARAEDPT